MRLWVALSASLILVLLDSLIESPTLRDIVRSLVLAVGAAIVVTALGIARRYWKNYKADPTKARLLPRHVVQLGVSVAMLTIAGCAEVISLIGEPFKWYATPMLLPGFTILLLGLIDMVRWLPNRTAPPTNDGRRTEDRPGHNER